MTKSKQYWSPRCNLWQNIVNKATTLTLALSHVTGIKTGVRQGLGTMHTCPFKFFRSFCYQQTRQTCSQQCLSYPRSSGFQLPPRQPATGGGTATAAETSHPAINHHTAQPYAHWWTVLHSTFFFTFCFFRSGPLQEWGRATLKALLLWLLHQGLWSLAALSDAVCGSFAWTLGANVLWSNPLVTGPPTPSDGISIVARPFWCCCLLWVLQ